MNSPDSILFASLSETGGRLVPIDMTVDFSAREPLSSTAFEGDLISVMWLRVSLGGITPSAEEERREGTG